MPGTEHLAANTKKAVAKASIVEKSMDPPKVVIALRRSEYALLLPGKKEVRLWGSETRRKSGTVLMVRVGPPWVADRNACCVEGAGVARGGCKAMGRCDMRCSGGQRSLAFVETGPEWGMALRSFNGGQTEG